MSQPSRTIDEHSMILPLRVDATEQPATPNNAVDVSLSRVSKSFGARSVLRDVDLFVERGEFVALVGRSGCGKSTLLRLIAGLETPTAGSIAIDAQPLAGVNAWARMMFQDSRLLPWLRVAENVAIGQRPGRAWSVDEALAKVGLADRGRDWPATLSGGQRQRVALARALIGHPPLLLLDEPLGATDALTRIEMQSLIYSLWKNQPCTAILVTHDIEEAVMLADRVVVLEQGSIRDEFQVNIPRPRDRADGSFSRLSQRLLERVLRSR